MTDAFNLQYKQLIALEDDFQRILSEREEFEKQYRTKSFWARQFDMELNMKRTNYKSVLEELSNNYSKLKSKLINDFQHEFFTNNSDQTLNGLIAENREILRYANFKLDILSIKPLVVRKRYIKFDGRLNENCEIVVEADNSKSNTVGVLFDGDFFLDFEGYILPNGKAHFEGRNVSDVNNYFEWGRNSVSGSWLVVPGIFTLQKQTKDDKFTIEANLKTGKIRPYTLKGFKILIDGIDKNKFISNVKIINNAFESLLSRYPLIKEEKSFF